jgi:hypothetical protein
MEDDLKIDTDPFLQLLTDALRSGPRSAEWHEAVARLNAGGIDGGEQYKALVDARENLESGKPYRSIRAGAGFTRKLETRLNAAAVSDTPDPSRTKLALHASVVSYIGAALLVGVIAVLIAHLSGSASEDLSGTFFSTILSAKLEGPLAPGWRTIGSLPVNPTNGLFPGVNHSNTDYLGGGLVDSSTISDVNVFAIEATFHFQHVNDGLIPQLFVSDNSDFNSPTAVSPHELTWLVRNGKGQVVLPSGELVGTSSRIADGSSVTVQIRIGPSQAMVLVDGNSVWSGRNQLTETPRYAGVRLLRRGGDKHDVVTVKNVRILER